MANPGEMRLLMERTPLQDLPNNIEWKIAECLDGQHTINPIGFGELMGLSPQTARHVAALWEGSSPTIRILRELQKRDLYIWKMYCVLKDMNSSAVQVLHEWSWRTMQGTPGGSNGYRSIDQNSEPSTCPCRGCHNSTPPSSLWPSCEYNGQYSRFSNNIPPRSGPDVREDSTMTKTLATSNEELRHSDSNLSFFSPDDSDSEWGSVSDIMNSLHQISNRNNFTSVEHPQSPPGAQGPASSLPAYQSHTYQDHPKSVIPPSSSYIHPASMPTLSRKTHCGHNHQVQAEGSCPSHQYSRPPFSSQPSSSGCLCGSPHCEHRQETAHNGTGSQQQHWNIQVPDYAAHSSPPSGPHSFNAEQVHHQPHMFPRSCVSLGNPQTSGPVEEMELQQAGKEHGLESARQSGDQPSAMRSQQRVPMPEPRPSPRPRSLSSSYALVVYGQRKWTDRQEDAVQRDLLDLLRNNQIPFITCSPNGGWNAEPGELVNQSEVRMDPSAFLEKVFLKAGVIIAVITPKVMRYTNPSSTNAPQARQNASYIVRRMRKEVIDARGNVRFYPLIMGQLDAHPKDNFDFLKNTIIYHFPSEIQQREFLSHLRAKLSNA